MSSGTIIDVDHQLPPHTETHRFGWRTAIGIVLLLLVGAIALWALHRRNTRPPPAPAPKVTTTAVPAKRGDIGVYLRSIGTVTPVYTASITSQVAGLVVGVHYTEGQRVRRGDPLVDVDSRPFRATLLQAEGLLQRDRNLLAQAKMDLARYRAAWARRAIAKQQLDDQEKIVLQAKGTVKNDEGQVAYARVQVDYCHITAPITGRVGLRLVDPGNVLQVAAAQPLAVITQIDPITVVFTLAEDDIARVQEQVAAGNTLAVEALDRSAQKTIANGKLLTLNNQIDTTTGTVKARAQFDNHDGKLFPNQFVNTRLLVETLRGVTLIPTAAIQQNGSESFVYVLQEGYAHLRKVKPGASEHGLSAVEGVAPGEQIATGSFDRLHEGVAVNVEGAP